MTKVWIGMWPSQQTCFDIPSDIVRILYGAIARTIWPKTQFSTFQDKQHQAAANHPTKKTTMRGKDFNQGPHQMVISFGALNKNKTIV